MSPTSILFGFIIFIALLAFLAYRIIEALRRIAARVEANNVHMGELRTEISVLTEAMANAFMKMSTKQEDIISSIEAIEDEIQDDDFYSDSHDMYEKAKHLVMRGGKGSASFLQRRLSIGYARAARILDQLEDEGIVGPARGASPRAVLKDL